MRDRDFLIWIHERLENVHGESPIVDYMHKLRGIIKNTPPNNSSDWTMTNSMSQLKRELKDDS